MPFIPPTWMFESNSWSTDLTPEQRQEVMTMAAKLLKSILVAQAHEILMFSMWILLLLSVLQILGIIRTSKTSEQRNTNSGYISNSKQLCIGGYLLFATLITYCLISEKSLVSIPVLSDLYSLWIQPFKSGFSYIWESNTESTVDLIFGMYGLFGMFMLVSFWEILV